VSPIAQLGEGVGLGDARPPQAAITTTAPTMIR